MASDCAEGAPMGFTFSWPASVLERQPDWAAVMVGFWCRTPSSPPQSLLSDGKFTNAARKQAAGLMGGQSDSFEVRTLL